jgi:tetratricopeptide (TPR) repeat protein
MNNKQSSLPINEINSVMALYSNSHFQKAVNQIKELNIQYPNEPLLFNLIGACYKELGHIDGASKMFESAIKIKPNYAEAHFNLGVVFKLLSREIDAIQSYKNAISINKNYPDAYNNLGTSLHELGHFTEAIESLEWAIAYKHDFAEAHNNLGNVLNDIGKVSDAINCFKKAISIDSYYTNAYFNLALAHKDMGNKESYIKFIEKTVLLKPDWGDANFYLSQVKKYTVDDPHLKEMETILLKNDLELVDQIGINFALAHAYESLDNNEKQFKFLDEANKLRKKEADYSFEVDKKRFLRVREIFRSHSSFLKKSSAKPEDKKPIFIVGMPRSGTSLVHQIIDSHNKVQGVGELTVLSKVINEFFRNYDKNNDISENELLEIRKKYLEYISSLNINENIFIDKMPLNFRHIGFIISAFPEAKIIHMNRDSMATCWSIYKYYFNGNLYSYNQEDLANYYNEYKNLMNFWNQNFPSKIYELSYENLTINQESETRKLIDYCELDWDENCLNFYKNKGVVKTTSALQVRQKMYQGSSEVWKKYEKHLQPLIKILGY